MLNSKVMVNSKRMESEVSIQQMCDFKPFSCHNLTIHLHNPNTSSTSEMNLTDLFCHRIPVRA